MPKTKNPLTLFVTYNPRNEMEQTLAVRLQTLGAIHGLNMVMPDRSNQPGTLNRETRSRILSSDYFIFFATTEPAPEVQAEIQAAYEYLNDPSHVVILRDRMKNIQPDLKNTTLDINSREDPIQDMVEKIMNRIREIKNTPNELGAILLIGLGLMMLPSARPD